MALCAASESVLDEQRSLALIFQYTVAMSEKARTDLKSWLEEMAALSPWTDVGDPSAESFIAAFAAARARALAAAPAYVEAVKKSTDTELKSWLGDMAALKRWADVGNAEHEPFVAAFSAARAKALAAADAAAKKA